MNHSLFNMLNRILHMGSNIFLHGLKNKERNRVSGVSRRIYPELLSDNRFFIKYTAIEFLCIGNFRLLVFWIVLGTWAGFLGAICGKTTPIKNYKVTAQAKSHQIRALYIEKLTV
ncbi:hypothetical protein BDA99DRAFT_543521 [Phascolomyces articulosus]|uniref:Uncharacterized protein n=1 Tax=Phascolomyces articulosus TaxID=60185 RepID=A0AAD5P7X7_9FUNG|nr:hypothetical protein BDA99DRAFT_543521 [Phascolomyces articulosus]